MLTHGQARLGRSGKKRARRGVIALSSIANLFVIAKNYRNVGFVLQRAQRHGSTMRM